VADSGADDAYTKGAGSVVLTLGASGMTLGSTKSDDPQVNYFAASSSNTYGITKFTATPTSLNADFVPASGGTFSDSFSITGDGGGGGGGGDDTTPPAVTNRSPAPGATGVLRGRNVTATFSEPVTGVNGTTMTLRRTSTGALISAAVSYDPTTRVATLDPTNRLPSSTQFTVTLTSGITDTAGNPLPTTTWTFTTAS
jgi:hypothetical protein